MELERKRKEKRKKCEWLMTAIGLYAEYRARAPFHSPHKPNPPSPAPPVPMINTRYTCLWQMLAAKEVVLRQRLFSVLAQLRMGAGENVKLVHQKKQQSSLSAVVLFKKNLSGYES